MSSPGCLEMSPEPGGWAAGRWFQWEIGVRTPVLGPAPPKPKRKASQKHQGCDHCQEDPARGDAVSPVEEDVLAAETAMSHPAGQAGCLGGAHIQGHLQIPRPVGIGQNVALLSTLLLLRTPQPHHRNRLWVETSGMTNQLQAAGTSTGARGQPRLWPYLSLEICLPCIKETREELWADGTEELADAFIGGIVLVEESGDLLSSASSLWRWQP